MNTKTPELLVRNALWVTAWRDLSPDTEPAEYRVTGESSETRNIWVSKKKRRMLDSLIDGPVHCASPCSLSHFVMGLRDEQGPNIKTIRFDNDPKAGRSRFGVYSLLDSVTRIGGQELAA
ncbi:hypothetical protein [Ruegeria sp. HKCCA0370]|uniref:hypothetical protein n=1 Tax=Ruegeria sp. HKCCA0370 TaxID=2682995 RepID=UPI0014878E3E|nr:hypothetical protein [Ruegeria sp. HKCCA0370]